MAILNNYKIFPIRSSGDGLNDSPVGMPTAPHVMTPAIGLGGGGFNDSGPATSHPSTLSQAVAAWNAATGRNVNTAQPYNTPGWDGGPNVGGFNDNLHNQFNVWFKSAFGFQPSFATNGQISNAPAAAAPQPTGIPAIVAQVTQPIAKLVEAVAPAPAPIATVAMSTVGNSTTDPTAPSGISAIPANLAAALQSALAGGGGGFISPDMSAGVPSTAGIVNGQTAALDALQPATAGTASTSNPALPLAIVGALAIGGFLLFEKLHKNKGKKPGEK